MSKSPEPLKTSVTGGSGAIGSAVVEIFSRSGDAIVNLDRKASAQRALPE